MRIQNGFRISLAAGIAIAIAAAVFVLFAQSRLSQAAAQSEQFDKISLEGMELVQLTSEVLLYRQPRAIEQWHQQYRDFAGLLENHATDHRPRLAEHIRRISASLADMRLLFENTMASEAKAPAAEIGGILTAQLFKKSNLLQSSLRSLKVASDAELNETYANTRSLMLFGFGIFAAINSLFAVAVILAFRRSVLLPVQNLDQTIRDINQGDPERRAEVLVDNEIGAVCRAFNDLLEKQESNRREIEYLAFHDRLTGLPNQALVRDRLDRATAYAERSATKVALLFLDLDNFKSINDTLGHPVGDALLKEVAERLGKGVRDVDTVSRQGGDEFLITLAEVSGAEAVTAVAEKLLESLATPFFIDGNELATSVSIGIALYPDDSHDFDTLLKKADTAMYEAKSSGRNTYRFFADVMNIEASEHLRIRNGLRRALERGEFLLHYQPQIDLATGAVIGAEALIRWMHPELGLVPPGRFIPIAEDSGLIVPIGEWVLREACWQTAAWRMAGHTGLTIAVNLSALQFKRGNIVRSVEAALKAAEIDPAQLELELTESIMIKDTDATLATVHQLKQLGVKLSIDDFGTGYSSLSYLKRFSVDKLKIDQSFVRDLASDLDDAAIVQAIIQMAHGLNLRTVAEGVENQQMLDTLRAYHCDEVQGYHFARPMPAVEFERYLQQQQQRQPAAEPGNIHRLIR